jgi:DNA-binding SARP family transcriptional activator
MTTWVDVEEFEQCYKAGQSFERKGTLAEAVCEYELAENLYQGDFLEEDLYEDWLIPRREGMKDSYLLILDRLSRYYLEEKRYTTCIQLCQKVLAKDDCREDAHRRLMRCYSRQGQPNLALRQYHLCEETLTRVLDVSPMSKTMTLYQQIRTRETI